jgi:hypothetical protein
MFGRGICEKNTSLETKFPSSFCSGNFSSLDWYFSQIPLPNMIYLYKIHFWLQIIETAKFNARLRMHQVYLKFSDKNPIERFSRHIIVKCNNLLRRNINLIWWQLLFHDNNICVKKNRLYKLCCHIVRIFFRKRNISRIF